MLGSAVCACVGQLLWKISADRGLLFMLAGFFFYGIGALIMLLAYRFGRVSVLQPILSCSYILSCILGAAVLNETVSASKCAGIFLIMAGVTLIAGGDAE